MAKKAKKQIDYHTDFQYYKGIQIRLIVRHDYHVKSAKRFTLNGTNQNVWIPNKHLFENGLLIPGQDIDYVFRRSQRQLEIAGYLGPIPGIKRTSNQVEI